MLKILSYIRFLPIAVFYPLYSKNKYLVMDVNRWQKSDKNIILKYAETLFTYKEFRNLFIYRNRNHKLFSIWIKLWYPPERTLFIEASDIGGGLYIQHGFATYISADKIGNNCWINQQVTIGYNNDGNCPVIGDNCMISCGAKVLGGVKIGNNTIIGANAVVIRDYKRGYGVLAGVPAKPIKEASVNRLKELGVYDESSMQ